MAVKTSEAIIMYLDLQGFTRIVEDSTPSELIGRLNEFFTVINEHILSEGGAVIQF